MFGIEKETIEKESLKGVVMLWPISLRGDSTIVPIYNGQARFGDQQSLLTLRQWQASAEFSQPTGSQTKSNCGFNQETGTHIRQFEQCLEYFL